MAASTKTQAAVKIPRLGSNLMLAVSPIENSRFHAEKVLPLYNRTHILAQSKYKQRIMFPENEGIDAEKIPPKLPHLFLFNGFVRTCT